MDRGTLELAAPVHEVEKSRTQLWNTFGKRLTLSTLFIYIYISFFMFFSIMVYHRILSIMPCAMK